jgi:hypothetical protein
MKNALAVTRASSHLGVFKTPGSCSNLPTLFKKGSSVPPYSTTENTTTKYVVPRGVLRCFQFDGQQCDVAILSPQEDVAVLTQASHAESYRLHGDALPIKLGLEAFLQREFNEHRPQSPNEASYMVSQSMIQLHRSAVPEFRHVTASDGKR